MCFSLLDLCCIKNNLIQSILAFWTLHLIHSYPSTGLLQIVDIAQNTRLAKLKNEALKHKHKETKQNPHIARGKTGWPIYRYPWGRFHGIHSYLVVILGLGLI